MVSDSWEDQGHSNWAQFLTEADIRAEKQKRRDERSHACFCIGPQNGAPLCPCAMRARRYEAANFVAEILKDYDLVPKKKGPK